MWSPAVCAVVSINNKLLKCGLQLKIEIYWLGELWQNVIEHSPFVAALTRWVPHDGYIRHQNDHLMSSVAAWRIYPSWVNDKLRAWEGLGHSGMFWATLSRDDFRSKLEIISFLSRVMSVSKSFFVSRAFERFGAKCSSSGAFGFDDVLGSFWKLRSVTGHFFCKLWLRPLVFLENFFSLFQSRAGITCLTAMAIPSLSKALWWWYVEN